MDKTFKYFWPKKSVGKYLQRKFPYNDVFDSQRDQILCMTLLSVIHMTTYIASMIGRSCVLTSQYRLL